MRSAELPQNEVERLNALLNYNVLDTAPESAFDELTQLAAQICQTPISLVSLIDKDRQWFKSKVGIDADSTPRELAFCAHAILEDDIFEIEDAKKDERFHDNPLVTGDAQVEFYAGIPLETPDGHNIGTLCVIDNKPKNLTNEQREALRTLGKQVIKQLELTQKLKMIAERNEEIAIERDHVKSMHQEILNDITYAKTVQKAILTNRSEVKKVFDNCVIVDLPKQHLSSHFYFFKETETNYIIGLGECTGYGIPASMLTIMCHEIINDAVSRRMSRPDRIITHLEKMLEQNLTTKKGKLKDTLKLGLCTLSKDKSKMTFSGAGMDLWIYDKEDQLKLAKGTREPIGASKLEGENTPKIYGLETNQELAFYLFTNGLVEQIGLNEEPYGHKRLSELFSELNTFSYALRKSVIEKAVDDWKGDRDQLHDIAVLGFSI